MNQLLSDTSLSLSACGDGSSNDSRSRGAARDKDGGAKDNGRSGGASSNEDGGAKDDGGNRGAAYNKDGIAASGGKGTESTAVLSIIAWKAVQH